MGFHTVLKPLGASLTISLLLALAPLPALAESPVSTAVADPTVPFKVIQTFSDSRIRTATQELIRTQADWLRFWQRHAGLSQSPPAIDFSREWVIAVLLGEVPTPGYSTCVASIRREAGKLQAQLRRGGPPEDSFMPMLPAAPGCLVSLPKQTDGEISFSYSTTSQTRTALPMHTLSQISNSRILTPRYVVAQDAESFRQLWIEHVGSADNLPAVDFSREMVVAAFMGEQPSGGYALTIQEVAEEAGHLKVRVLKSRPSPEQMVIQMLTAPAHLLAIPRRDLPIDFED
ncbi:MAG: protease complex subunit PrcB family protein [Candidatus Sericytochromatia bacterium]